MTKQFYIVLWMLLGFFANPAVSLACGTSFQNVEMVCCSSKDTDNMDCCDKTSDIHTGADSDCGDSCSSASCDCSTISLISYFAMFGEWNTIFPNYHSNSYFHKDALTSTGFTLIWLPPKLA